MKTILKITIGLILLIGLSGCGAYNQPSLHGDKPFSQQHKKTHFYNGF
jgi:uncharacterized protein YxeA